MALIVGFICIDGGVKLRTAVAVLDILDVITFQMRHHSALAELVACLACPVPCLALRAAVSAIRRRHVLKSPEYPVQIEDSRLHNIITTSSNISDSFSLACE
jgi:hypothetical protein